MSAEELKEEELMNTMKMEPILEKTMILEEPLIVKKEKKVKIIDYVLISLIAIVTIVFILVLIKIK